MAALTSQRASGTGVAISLAGRATVAVGPGSPDDLGVGPLGQVAFGYLVLERSRPVTRDELADAIWGEDPPPTWRSALRGVVSRLRSFLTEAGLDGAAVLTSVGGCYVLRLPVPVVVDVERARNALAGAREAMSSADANRAVSCAAEAAALLRGQFLAGSTGAWAEQQQEVHEETLVQALEVLADAATAAGETATALEASGQAVALRPLRETAHRRVMTAHARAGNRAEALRAYERCRRILLEELGVSPSPATESVYVDLLREDRLDTPAGRPGGFPAPPTSFVGRRTLVEEVAALQAHHRLVTLLGPGGVGKSRLAVEVARTAAGHDRGEVALVELADLHDPGLLDVHVLSALGLPEIPECGPEEALTRHLGSRTLLVVLDNCEHVVEASAALVASLLGACPGVRLLTTSRQRLHAPGEVAVTVPPLPVPDAGGGTTLDDLLRSDAARLFVERARAAAPGVDITPARAAIAEICRRLDGIPLALELAAARVRSVGVVDLAERVTDRLRLLVGAPGSAIARHRTMRAAIDWSYESLDPPERKLFRELCVFAGGFTLRAAEAVATAGPGLIESLSLLVERSLIETQHSGGTVRYRILETLRQYGIECASASGELSAARARHLAWAADLARTAAPELDGPDQATWLQVLDAEHDNFRSALDWAAVHDPRLGLETAAAIWRYYEVRGHLSEGRARLEALASTGALPAPLRARALNAAGVLAQRHRDHAGARLLHQSSLEICARIGDGRGRAIALHGLGNVAVGQGDLDAARAAFEQNLSIAGGLDDSSMAAATLINLGVVTQLLFVSGRIDQEEGAAGARGRYEESLALYRRLGDTKGIALALENIGAVAPYLGDLDLARSSLEQSLAIRRQLGDPIGIAATTRFLGQLALRSGELAAARHLHEQSLAIERELGNRQLVAADLASLAAIAEAEGHPSEAVRLLEESLAIHTELGDDEAVERLLTRIRAIVPARR